MLCLIIIGRRRTVLTLLQDFGAYNPLEVCSDSEDDDGDNYHWESHHHQTVRLSSFDLSL